MAVAAAEHKTVRVAHEAYPESEEVARHRFEQLMGGVAVRGAVAAPEYETPRDDSTLLHTARQAAAGDKAAERMMETNISTDIMERLYNIGRTRVGLSAKDGAIQQEGRRVTDIYRNTLEHTSLIPEMLRRTKQELKNTMVFESLHGEGVLEDDYAVVFSTRSTKMSIEEKKEYNFFLDTESCSIQMLSAEGDDLTLDTAFVAGKATPDSECHDLDAIKALAEKYGVSVATEDGTGVLQYVLLIPKSELPGGLSDVVMAYDEAAGGTFYGQAYDGAPKTSEDYERYAEECLGRTEQFDDIVQAIKQQLIAESAHFRTPLEAILRLDELSEQYCVGHAIEDRKINTAIFGPTAAMHIEEARFFMERGEYGRAEQSTSLARATATSGSCPLRKSQVETNTDDDTPGSEKDSKKRIMKCPHCDTKVFGDPCAKILSCGDCMARVVNGNTQYKGDGGTKASEANKAARRRQEAARREAELARKQPLAQGV